MKFVGLYLENQKALFAYILRNSIYIMFNPITLKRLHVGKPLSKGKFPSNEWSGRIHKSSTIFFQSLESAHYSDVYKLRAATNGQTKLSDVNNTKHK